MSTIDKVKTMGQLLRLWHNECLRIFYDRLINDHDKDIVQVEFQNSKKICTCKFIYI
jgi:dynein heavy chain